MTSSIYPKISFFVLLFILSPVATIWAQSTYKVVCDKTDHTVKIIEAENRSANFVTIKTGFPFRQVAQKWIDENYSTTKCEPNDFILPNNQAGTPAPASQNSIENPLLSSSVTTPGRTFLQPRRNATQQFRNTSFLVSGRFSTLGEAFSLQEKLMFGAGAGFEQLFGGNLYVGTGIHMDFYFSDMDGQYNEDKELLYHFRIPAFVGYRKPTQKLLVMYEAGIGFNTKLTGTPLIVESFGPEANNSSFNFMARLKVGSPKVMFMMGSDIWLSQILDMDFNFTSLNAGFCFFF